MIVTKLDVEQMCRECPMFEPEMKHRKASIPESVKSHHLLIITCKNQRFCLLMWSYLRGENK